MKFSRKPIAAVIAASALSMALAVPAFASTANTSVTLQADDAQLSVTAPASIPLSAKADGMFIAPAPTSTKIVNNSVMPVAVKSIQVKNVLTGTKLVVPDSVSQGSDGAVTPSFGKLPTDPNTWFLVVNGAKLSTADTATVGTDWNMGGKNGFKDDLQLIVGGGIANVDSTVDFSAAKTLGSIQWTFGSAPNA